MANYPPILSESLRMHIIQTSPIQIDIKFPSSNGRSFSNNYYFKTLCNNEKVKREWLIYSKKLDSVHCFCCYIFDSHSNRNSLSSREGYRDWSHLSRTIKIHRIHPIIWIISPLGRRILTDCRTILQLNITWKRIY